MDLLRVEAALLRAQLPDLVLRPGMTLPGRVMERHGQLGILMLAGRPLSAELPDELQAGDRLRLRVEEVGADRVVLRAVEKPAAAGPAPPPPPDPPPPPPLRLAPAAAGGPPGRGARHRAGRRAPRRERARRGGAALRLARAR